MRGSEGECLAQPGRILAQAPDLLDNEALDLGGRKRLRRARVPAPLLGLGTDVVAIAWTAVLARIGRRHGTATRPTAQQPLQKSPEPVPSRRAAVAAVTLQEHLHALPDFWIYDRLVLACVNLVPVPDLADVGDVTQQLAQAGLRERLAAALAPLTRDPALRDPATPVELFQHREQGLVLQVQIEDGHADSFLLVDQELGAARVEI